MRILAISGSLRAASANTALLEAARLLAPAGVEISLYDGLGRLPHFNPDLDNHAIPPAAAELRRAIGLCDGLLISSPEYAHGVPGSLKNALDWLVGSLEFPNKPVALIGASEHSVHAPAQLMEVLATMSASICGEASITLPLFARRLDAQGIAADPEHSPRLRAALEDFVLHIELRASEAR